MLIRIKVILSSVVTWGMFATLVLSEVASTFPTTAEVIGRVLVFVAGVVAVIRKVTPAIPGTEGLVVPNNDV